MITPQRHAEAMDKVNSLVSVRERNIQEVRERLLACDFTAEEADDAIETALRVNLINEERYARAFIRGKLHSGWGKIKIVQRLQRNGIDQSIILACEDEFRAPQAEYHAALAELSKRSARSKDPYATFMRRLLGRGYSYEVAQRAVRTHLSAQDLC